MISEKAISIEFTGIAFVENAIKRTTSKQNFVDVPIYKNTYLRMRFEVSFCAALDDYITSHS